MTTPNSATARLFADDIHPRLFFGPDDLPQLRQKAQRQPCRRTYDRILAGAEAAVSPASPSYVDPSASKEELLRGFGGGALNAAAFGLHCLAFAYVFTGEKRWAEAAIRIVMRFIGDPQSAAEAAANPEFMFGKICHETLANNLTFVYDFCYECFSEDERRTVKKYLRGVCAGYRATFLHHPRVHKFGLGNNTFWRTFEKYVVTMAACWTPAADEQEMPDILAFLRRSIHRGLDEGGAIYEGPGYGWRDSEWLSYMAEILYRMGAIDLWRDEPRFARMFRQWAYLVLPGERGQNDYCDAHRLRPDRPMVGMLLAAKRLDEPVFQWIWQQLGGRSKTPDAQVPPGRFCWALGQSLLWEDPKADVHDPGAAGWPGARGSGNAGVMVMRSGWTDDDAYASLLASTRDSGNNIHQQVDAGHFSFFALGEAFSVDSGYGDILGRYHSVMMPNAAEPTRAPHTFGQMFFGGRPAAFAAGKHADYARVNIGEQWECHWAYRHMLLVKAPGASPCLVLLDNVNFGSAHRMYRWQMNSEPGNVVETHDDQERAVVTGKRHRVEVAWAYPEPGAYPKDHWLELRAAEIDSFNWLAKRDPTGMGPRPQLHADLWGYNGQLLSLLVPRRREEAPVVAQRIFGADQFGLVVQFGEVTDTITASPVNRRLDIGGMAGEASIAVARRDASGACLYWAAADAYALSIDGETVLDHQPDPVTLAE